MRANGVRSLLVECRGCKRTVSVVADQIPDHVLVPDAGLLFKCSACGSRDVGTRPDWNTKTARP